MKNNYKILIVIVALIMGSCGKDFLELEPQQSLSISGAVTDIVSLNASVRGLYNNLQDANIYGWDHPLIPDLRGDNAYISSKNAGRFLGFDEYALTDQNGRSQSEWADHYEVIVNASNVINGIANVEFPMSDQAEADGRLGEAHALRGLTYWNLLKLFAKPYAWDNGASLGVPLNNAGTSGEILIPTRATVAEVYAQVISDLETAIGKITTTSDGRLSKAAAQAILAKVYLYQENWGMAESMATASIGNSGYSLYADGAAWAASWGANIGSEDLFAVINLPTDNLGVNSMGGIVDQDGYGDVLATDELYDAYSATDIRRTMLIRGDRQDGEQNALFPEGKYPNGETGDDYIKVMRLADVYLIRAEARAEQGGSKEADARADLTAVASRVDPSYTATTATGQALIDEIIDERRKEFAFEGDRVYDLMRKQMTWVKTRTFETENVMFNNNQLINPIPRSETDLNPDLVQNDGY